jgi:hypothetical protein
MVAVVQTTDKRDADHSPRPRKFYFSRERGVRRQRAMGPHVMIVVQEAGQEPSQVRLVQDDHMIQTFPTEGTDQSLHIRVLPRRTRCNQDFLDAHVLELLPDGIPIDRIPVADQVAWRLVKRKGFPKLLDDPGRCRL